MSVKFIHSNFSFENKYAEELYHNYSKKQPILDYHNHLPPQQISENTIFNNLTKVWIDDDHYKWRAMRTLGVSEEFVTEKSSDKDKLTNTIIYNLNPADNEVIASMIGNFNDGSVKEKVQFGSACWFLDQKDGMTKQLNILSNMGLISCFIGMLTDFRSFLSFPRYEYFRGVLCNLLGDEIKRGELPNVMEWIGKLVADISYNNTKRIFQILKYKNSLI
tara:strand:- start:7745 stop:8401 length:657 start_codon:yes stop_codon:yes gene_type:complete